MYVDVLTVLFSAFVVGVLGQTVEQPELSWTKAEKKRAYIRCKVTGLQADNYVHWYQQKDGEAPKRILYVNQDGSSTIPNSDHPEAKDFSVELQNNNDYVLRVKELKLSHEGVYYCACWDSSSGAKVFGAGTRLYVTGDNVVSPKLSVYPIVDQGNGKSVLLCQARDMFPGLVRFTWKEGNKKVEEGVLEQEDKEGETVKRVTSMLVVDKEDASSNTYTCSVQHDSSNSAVVPTETIPKGDPNQPDPESPAKPSTTCPPQTSEENEANEESFGGSQLVQKLYLFNLTYVSLLLKNVLYFCAVGVMLYKRRAGNSETVSKPSPTSKQDN